MLLRFCTSYVSKLLTFPKDNTHGNGLSRTFGNGTVDQFQPFSFGGYFFHYGFFSFHLIVLGEILTHNHNLYNNPHQCSENPLYSLGPPRVDPPF